MSTKKTQFQIIRLEVIQAGILWKPIPTPTECFLIKESPKLENHPELASSSLPTLRWGPSVQDRNLAEMAGAWHLRQGKRSWTATPLAREQKCPVCAVCVRSPTQALVGSSRIVAGWSGSKSCGWRIPGCPSTPQYNGIFTAEPGPQEVRKAPRPTCAKGD